MALAMIPILIGSGAAVDYSRAYMVKSRLSHALDQAGLAVGSSNPTADLDDVLINFYFPMIYFLCVLIFTFLPSKNEVSPSIQWKDTSSSSVDRYNT